MPAATKKAATKDHLQALAARTEDCIAEVAQAAAEAIEEAEQSLSTPMTGAEENAPGASGMVPKPAAGQQGAFLRGDGTWAQPNMAGATFYVGSTAPTDEVIWFKTKS